MIDYPLCNYCNKEIRNGKYWVVEIDGFYSECCCRKHAIDDFVASINEELAKQLIFDIWETYAGDLPSKLLELIHVLDGKSAKTTNRQFDLAQKYIVRNVKKDRKFAETLADRYIEMFEDEYDEEPRDE